jgi:O-antigen ligase
MKSGSSTRAEKVDIPLITLLVIASAVTIIVRTDQYDPINLPKLYLLSLGSVFLALFFSLKRVKFDLDRFKLILFSLSAFIATQLASIINGGEIYKGVIGAYGRNLGLLTYLSLALTMVLAAMRANIGNIQSALYVIFILGIFESAYGVIQHFGLDPINWLNPYSPIIGTFGNPNYMSAFLGITTIVSLYFFTKSERLYLRLVALLEIIVSVWLIQSSSSSQGLLAIYVGMGIYTLSLIEKNKIARISGITIFFAGLILGIIGILNRGPFSFVYQSSISARGDYWRSAISMFNSNPVFGVGVERFGDFFGTNRDLRQVRLRGYGTFSDNAHNTFLQFISTGGLLLFLTYLVLISIIARYAIKIFQRNSDQFKSRAIVSTWVGALTISLLSPENIGFTIWSWVLGGLIIGVYKNEENSLNVGKLGYKSKTLKEQFSTLRFTTVGVLLLLLFPLTLFVFNSHKSERSIFIAYGLARSQQTTITQVSQFIDKSVTNSPYEEKYLALAGNLYLSIQEYEKGVMKGIELESLNPNSQDALRIQAFGYEKLNQLSEAINARVRLTKIDPLGLGNLSDLVLDYGLNKDFTNANEALKQMKRIDSSNRLTLSVEESLRNLKQP